MFTESGEIGTTAMKASTLFEKELCKSMKQTSISDFFKKKIYLYIYDYQCNSMRKPFEEDLTY